MSDELNEIWDLYVDDGSQSLDAVEAVLMGTRDAPADAAAIATLFRAMHTFKGNSRVLGLSVIESRAHLAEDLVGLVRDEGVVLDGELVELLLETTDALRGMMEAAHATRRDADEATTADLVARMRHKFERCRRGEGVAATSEAQAPPELVDAVVFEPMDQSSLIDDPVYREIFTGMVGDVLAALRQALNGPDEARAGSAAEAERLRFAADQLGLAEWVRTLEGFLALAQPGTAAIGALCEALSALFERDFAPAPAATAPEPAEAVVFEPMAAGTLADDPVYREIFAGMAHDMLREMRQALERLAAEPQAARETLTAEAERLRFAAEQMGLARWVRPLTEFLALEQPEAVQADALLDHLAALFEWDCAAAAAPTPAASPLSGTADGLDAALGALANLGARLTAGAAPDPGEVTAVTAAIAAAAEPLGLPGLSDAAARLATAGGDAEAFRRAEFRFYEELAAVEEAAPERLGGTVRPRALLRAWCADRVFESLLDLGNALEAIRRQGSVNGHCERVDERLRHVYYACRHYDMETAAHLTMALVDLFARVRSGELPADALLMHTVKSFVAAMELVFDAANAGQVPDMAAIEDLFHEASGVAFAASGVVSATAIETRLGLPRSFHKVLTPESVHTAVAALEAGHHFYIVRADLNRDETVAGQFLTWINAGGATVVSNVTVFQGDTTLFDFLLASPLDAAGLTEALASLDPGGAVVRVEMTLTDRKAAPPSAHPHPATEEADAHTAVPHEAPSGAMLEAIGEIVTGQAMLHHTLATLLEEDLVHSVESAVRAAGNDWGAARQGVRRYLEGVQEKIEKLGQIETQVNGLLDRLQEEAIGARKRPAALLLRPLSPLVEALAHQSGRRAALTTGGDDVALDVSTLEGLKEPLRALLGFCVGQSIEPPPQRSAAGKEAVGQLRVTVVERDDQVVVTVEDDGIGIDLARVAERSRQLGWDDESNLINRVLHEQWGVTANDPAGAGAVDFAQVAATLRRHGGELHLADLPGGGVRFVLTLPLAMVVLEGMVVRAGEVMYVVPIDAIQRIVHAGSDELLRVTAGGGHQMLRLGRDELLPVRLLGAAAEPQAGESGETEHKRLFVVAGKQSRRVAIAVDELVGQQSVLIRPLQGYLSGIRDVSGCALLGNGGVGMVLDVGGVVNR